MSTCTSDGIYVKFGSFSLKDGGVDGDAFYNFVYIIERHLLPHMPFDSHNPHNVLVMDNCAIHHVSRTVEMIYETDALVHFLPPYSPDYNPIEGLFSKVKTVLKGIAR